jgi:outer membrane immunogenic protein
MKTILLGCAAVSLATVSAFGADLAVPPPVAPLPQPFSWTSCYGGAQVGGSVSRKDITDPVQLAQDSVLGAGTTVGVTTTRLDSTGFLAGAQIGCDYQFYSHLLIGIEGEVAGSTTKSSTVVGFPASPGDQGVVSSKTDFLPSVTARLGVAVDRVLFYGKGGVAWAGDQTNVVGSIAGTPFSFQGLSTRTGFIAGGGVDWAFSGPWSVNVEYDYYGFGHGNVFMTDSINGFTGLVDTKQSIQVVKVGLNFHLWSSDE